MDGPSQETRANQLSEVFFGMNVENVKEDYNSDSDEDGKFNVNKAVPRNSTNSQDSLIAIKLSSSSNNTSRRGLVRIPSRHMAPDSTDHILIKVGNSKSRSFDLGEDEAKPPKSQLLTRARSAIMKFRPELTIQTAPKGLARQGSWIDHTAALPEDNDEIVDIKDEEIQLAIKLETQRTNYNEDMFSSLQPADKDEVEILENSGYTFQEAIEVIFNRKHGLEVFPVPERKYSNRSMSSVGMDSPTAMMLKKRQGKEGKKEAKKALKTASFTYQQSSNNNLNNTSAYQSMPISAFQTPLNGSFYAVSPMPPPVVYPPVIEQDSSWIEAYRINCLSNCSEAEQIRLSMMESKQEERCAIGMFDALRPEDKEEVTFYLSLGYRFENIALYFFQRRYEPDALESNPDAQAMMADFQEQRQQPPPLPVLSSNHNSSFTMNQYYDTNRSNNSSYHNLPVAPPAPMPPSINSLVSVTAPAGMSYADRMLQNRLSRLAQEQQQLQLQSGGPPPAPQPQPPQLLRPLHQQMSFHTANNSFTQQSSSFTSSSHNGSYQNLVYVTTPTTPGMISPTRLGMPGKAPSFADMMLQSRLERLAQESAMLQHQQLLQQQYQPQRQQSTEYDDVDFLALGNSQKNNNTDEYDDEEEVEEEEHQQPQQFVPQWFSAGSKQVSRQVDDGVESDSVIAALIATQEEAADDDEDGEED